MAGNDEAGTETPRFFELSEIVIRLGGCCGGLPSPLVGEGVFVRSVNGRKRMRGSPTTSLEEKLAEIGVDEKEANVKNKFSRGKFTAAFFFQWLSAINLHTLHLD